MTITTDTDHVMAPDHMDAAPATRMVTIREAARMAGTTPDAIRGRVERGKLEHVKQDGVRMIPVAELRRVGLLATASAMPMAGTTVDATDLLERLLDAERRATLAESQRLLVERTGEMEREAMTLEVMQLRAKVLELEAIANQPKRWFGRARKAPTG